MFNYRLNHLIYKIQFNNLTSIYLLRNHLNNQNKQQFSTSFNQIKLSNNLLIKNKLIQNNQQIRSFFIQTQETPNHNSLKFLPGKINFLEQKIKISLIICYFSLRFNCYRW